MLSASVCNFCSYMYVCSKACMIPAACPRCDKQLIQLSAEQTSMIFDECFTSFNLNGSSSYAIFRPETEDKPSLKTIVDEAKSPQELITYLKYLE